MARSDANQRGLGAGWTRGAAEWRRWALWVFVLYVAVAAAWVYGLQFVIAGFSLGHPAECLISASKDMLFVVATAALPYALVVRSLLRRRMYEESQKRVLELLATGAPLGDVLTAIVRMVEEQNPQSLGSILLLEGHRAHTAAAPSLPQEYSRGIDGLVIGPTAGSCGTAMHTARRVIVEDIATDPLWEKYRTAALPYGLRACWSEPIVGSAGEVLGSLAMYYRTVRSPAPREISQISTAAHLAGIAIERRRAEDAQRSSEATTRALLSAVPDVMFRMDRAGKYLDFHAPDPSRLLVPPEKFLGRSACEVLPAEHAKACLKNLALLFSTGRPQAYEYESNQDGRQSTWEVRMVRSGADEALLVLRDITDRRAAERRLRESEERLRLLIRNTPLGVIFWDSKFCIGSWNPGAERIFGWPAAEAIGRHWTLIVPEDQREYVSGITNALMANTGGSRGTNRNVRNDGGTIFCEWYNTSLVDEVGKVVGVASVVEDVTERHQAQQRQELMMRELDHRVKNNLASIASLAEQTGRSTGDKAEFIESFTGRLRAMARLHSLLTRSHGQGVDLALLVRQTFDTFGAGQSPRTTMNGPGVALDARTGQALAMALNELATNAIKYGALSVPEGRVSVEWTVAPPAVPAAGADGGGGAGAGRLELVWTERGGPPPREPRRRGFGTDLIQGTISHELGGTARLEFTDKGAECTVVVPMALSEGQPVRVFDATMPAKLGERKGTNGVA